MSRYSRASKDLVPKPDIILGQHVMVGIAGHVGHKSGAILSGGDSLQIKIFGQGSHGSQPQNSVDPVIMAAATTMKKRTTVTSIRVKPEDRLKFKGKPMM